MDMMEWGEGLGVQTGRDSVPFRFVGMGAGRANGKAGHFDSYACGGKSPFSSLKCRSDVSPDGGGRTAIRRTLRRSAGGGFVLVVIIAA